MVLRGKSWPHTHADQMNEPIFKRWCERHLTWFHNRKGIVIIVLKRWMIRKFQRAKLGLWKLVTVYLKCGHRRFIHSFFIQKIIIKVKTFRHHHYSILNLKPKSQSNLYLNATDFIAVISLSLFSDKPLLACQTIPQYF